MREPCYPHPDPLASCHTVTAVVSVVGRRVPAASLVCWAMVLPGAAWALVRTLGLERGPLVQLLAFTPYVAVAALVPLAVTLLARRWWAAGVAAVTVLALAVAVLPRALPSGDAPTEGPRLQVMTANLLAGAADAATVVALVRDHDVDVLTLQELTPQGQRRLHAAGLPELLPHQAAEPLAGTSGSAVYARLPLHGAGVRTNEGGFRQAYATVAVPDARPVQVESVHSCPPMSFTRLACWWTALDGQPPATPDGPVRILAGDFNATLDHVAMRRLVHTGYRDAADTVGAGLSPTWDRYGERWIPPVAIDRVLVDERVGVLDVTVHRLPGSDHRAVIATLALPQRAVRGG